jgi:hypothetical protein
MTAAEFTTWFDALDLGDLEDVRAMVLAHAEENAATTDDAILGGEATDLYWDVTKATVLMYLDVPELAEEFNYYR